MPLAYQRPKPSESRREAVSLVGVSGCSIREVAEELGAGRRRCRSGSGRTSSNAGSATTALRHDSAREPAEASSASTYLNRREIGRQIAQLLVRKAVADRQLGAGSSRS